jgi:DNA-binding transcriptional regulator YiaG
MMVYTGESIRALRKWLGLTQQAFAVKLGVTVATISRWEHEHAIPSPLARGQMERLIAECGYNPDEGANDNG